MIFRAIAKIYSRIVIIMLPMLQIGRFVVSLHLI